VIENMSSIVLSDWFNPVYGGKEGKCVVCGRFSKKGHPIDFSPNFTMYSVLEGGNIICEYCRSMLDNQDLRRHSWIAYIVDGEKILEKLDRKRVLEYLCDPPNPPFVIYVTRTGKKQGYLMLVNRVNMSRNFYNIVWDDVLIPVFRDRVVFYHTVVKNALEKGLRKSELLHGCMVKNWDKRDICCMVEKYRGDILWRLVVWAS